MDFRHGTQLASWYFLFVFLRLGVYSCSLLVIQILAQSQHGDYATAAAEQEKIKITVAREVSEH